MILNIFKLNRHRQAMIPISFFKQRQFSLYQAFQELGRVIRTQFLLEYISNVSLREIITASTTKVEAYNALSDWILFGSKVIVASNDPDEMEKAVKYNALIANCIVLHNIIDYSYIIHQLQQEGYDIVKEDVARLSPYLTEHLKRFGDYVLDMQTLPENIDMIKMLACFRNKHNMRMNIRIINISIETSKQLS